MAMAEHKYKKAEKGLWILAFAVSVTTGLLLLYVKLRFARFGIHLPF
jgi:hypothetical protein